MNHPVVSRDQSIAERLALLAHEKQLTGLASVLRMVAR